MNDIVAALWLFLPAGIANMAPVIANKIPAFSRWQAPLDGGRNFRGKRILGDNKTWRGVVFGTVLAGCVGLSQQVIRPTDDPGLIIFIIAALLGFGALYGDAVESFFKRQFGVPAGHSWFPFDQIDYIVGGLVAVAPLALFSWAQMGAIFIVYFSLHLLVAYLGFLLKLKDRPI